VLAFKSIENEEWESAYLKEVSAQIKDINGDAISDRIAQLSTLINKLNSRLNLVVDIIMNVLFVWNIRQIISIEKWKRNNQESLETAFDVLAEFEAVISLASLRINYPEWVFPQIADGAGYTLNKPAGF